MNRGWFIANSKEAAPDPIIPTFDPRLLDPL